MVHGQTFIEHWLDTTVSVLNLGAQINPQSCQEPVGVFRFFLDPSAQDREEEGGWTLLVP